MGIGLAWFCLQLYRGDFPLVCSAMSDASLVWVRRGDAYYEHDGLTVVGFGGNGNAGCDDWNSQYNQVGCL
jgi:hypothetical protein